MSLFIKGFFMGLADLVPGISGGTVAFMAGIYKELIFNLEKIDSRALRLFFSFRFRVFFTYINAKFFLRLFSGIVLAILGFSRLFCFLLSEPFYRTCLYMLFFGVICAAAGIFFKRIIWRKKQAAAFIAGLLFLFSLLFVRYVSYETAGPLWLILSGMAAVGAMLLPGISGSFMLLIFGVYIPALEALASLTAGFNFEALILLCYLGIGIAFGFLLFPRMIACLMRRHYPILLPFLLGLTAGSLFHVWPFSLKENIFSFSNVLPFCFGFLGFGLFFLKKFRHNFLII